MVVKTDLIQCADRFESLGDNCEFGFVLQSMGLSDGSLFKWARIDPDQLLALLQQDFQNILVYENLAPLRLTMVVDKKYGIGWHTALYSHVKDGALIFTDGEKKRKLIFKREQKKFGYLLSKFIKRLQAGGIILVIKSNAGIGEELIQRIHAEFKRLAGHKNFWLLRVSSANSKNCAGTMVDRGGGRLDGFVNDFAGYNTADDFDAESWTSIVKAALCVAEFPDWATVKKRVAVALNAEYVRLEFPAANNVLAQHNLSSLNLNYDVCVSSNNSWTRVIDQRLRLHAATGLIEKASVVWSGLKLSKFGRLDFGFMLATVESKKVYISLKIYVDSILVNRKEIVVIDTDSVEHVVFLEHSTNSVVNISMEAECVGGLASGQVCVVDISMPELTATT